MKSSLSFMITVVVALVFAFGVAFAKPACPVEPGAQAKDILSHPEKLVQACEKARAEYRSAHPPQIDENGVWAAEPDAAGDLVQKLLDRVQYDQAFLRQMYMLYVRPEVRDKVNLADSVAVGAVSRMEAGDFVDALAESAADTHVRWMAIGRSANQAILNKYASLSDEACRASERNRNDREAARNRLLELDQK